ncbi:hypothetical protein [Methyloceanibacter marginalis]|uniref:hypothetical protein n=1 Tax=Methyloceanibacter marginalis TaxID=1774971 RepID=UPI00114CC5D1|nr:hypothetical protein [Methyloceanibacter marginalis]
MNRKLSLPTICFAVTALALAANPVYAADEEVSGEGGEGGGQQATAAEMPEICQKQAANRTLPAMTKKTISRSATLRKAK